MWDKIPYYKEYCEKNYNLDLPTIQKEIDKVNNKIIDILKYKIKLNNIKKTDIYKEGLIELKCLLMRCLPVKPYIDWVESEKHIDNLIYELKYNITAHFWDREKWEILLNEFLDYTSKTSVKDKCIWLFGNEITNEIQNLSLLLCQKNNG